MIRLQSLVLRYPIRYPLIRLVLFLMCSPLECLYRRPRYQSASWSLRNLQALSFLPLVKFFPNILARINCQRPAPFLSLTSGNWKEPGWGGKKKALSWNSIKVKANDTSPIHAARCLQLDLQYLAVYLSWGKKAVETNMKRLINAVAMEDETDGWWK